MIAICHWCLRSVECKPNHKGKPVCLDSAECYELHNQQLYGELHRPHGSAEALHAQRYRAAAARRYQKRQAAKRSGRGS